VGTARSVRQRVGGQEVSAYRSKTMFAVDALRTKILAGDIGPGERFDVRRIAAELEMSITPVREALRVLQADGLVSYDEHRSISAMELKAEDAVELYLLRSSLESLATRLATDRWTDDDEAAIRGAHVEMTAAAKAGDPGRTSLANRTWHFAVYGAAHTRFVEPAITRLWVQIAWSATWSVPGRLQASVVEHQAITDALLARKPRQAEKLMREHINGGQRAVLEHGDDTRS